MDNDKVGLVFDLDITKVDAEQRLVEGWASADIEDRQGDKIPFSVMMQTMGDYADVIGIREMHQPKAVGTLTKWWGDESSKRVGVQVYLSKSRDGEDALQKVKEGVLKGFSIGGKALDWSYEGMKRVIKKLSLTEISLVDVPANPQALITLVKFDGDKADVMEQLGDTIVENIPDLEDAQDVQEITPDQVPDIARPEVVHEIEQPKVEKSRRGRPSLAELDVMKRFIESVEKYETIKALEAGEKEKQIADLVNRGKNVGIARREGEAISKPAGYPEDWTEYGDPANWGWPMDNPDRARSALAYYNGGRGKSKYSPREWAVLGRRIARLAGKQYGADYEYIPADKQVQRKELTKMSNNLNKGVEASVLGDLRDIVSQAAEQMSNPEQAQGLMNQALAALDVIMDQASKEAPAASTASTPSASTTSAKSPVTEEKADVTIVSASDHGGESSSPSSSSSTTSSSSSTPSTESVSTGSYGTPETISELSMVAKALMEAANAMKAAMEHPMAKADMPAGDVPVKVAENDAVLDALNGGNVRKAIAAAGGNIDEVYKKADAGTLDVLKQVGVTSERYYILKGN